MIEEVFKTRTKKINDQDVVQPFLAKVVDIGNASCSRVRIIDQPLYYYVNLRHPTKILYVRYSSRS